MHHIVLNIWYKWKISSIDVSNGSPYMRYVWSKWWKPWAIFTQKLEKTGWIDLSRTTSFLISARTTFPSGPWWLTGQCFLCLGRPRSELVYLISRRYLSLKCLEMTAPLRIGIGISPGLWIHLLGYGLARIVTRSCGAVVSLTSSFYRMMNWGHNSYSLLSLWGRRSDC